MSKPEEKDLFDNDGNVPGLEEDAVAEGGVDPTNDPDQCEGGACKI